MLIQIQPIQVPAFWEVIKFAAVKADNIKKENLDFYCLTLLQDLLANKKNCFIEQDENHNVIFVLIFSLNIEPMTGIKYLYIANIYSFKTHGIEEWKDVFNDMQKIANRTECQALAVNTTNPRAIEVAGFLGFELFTSKYYKYL